MDSLKEEEKKENKIDRVAGLDSLRSKLRELYFNKDGKGLLWGAILFCVGVLFSRCHIVFGMRPLGVTLAALMPWGVWVSSLGAIIGSLTLGKNGIVYGVAVLVTVLLRVIVSGGIRDGQKTFSEGLGARMAESVVGGFIVAANEILFGGLSVTTVVAGASMIVLPPLILFLLSGLFCTDVQISDIFSGTRNVFSLSKKSDTEKMDTVFFALSSLCALFLLTLSLSELVLFGISAAYVFVSFITLILSKRLGALRGLVVGFVSPLGISGIHSVSFGLAGLGSGLTFGFGTVYGLIAGGGLLAAFSGYTGNIEGLLSTLPEYLIGAVLAWPCLGGISMEKTPTEEAEITKNARDMVGTVALKYKNSPSRSLDALETSLASLATVIRGYSDGAGRGSLEYYRDMVIDIAEAKCAECDGCALCREQGIKPCVKRAEAIAGKLCAGQSVTGADVNTDTEFCQHADEIAEEIMRSAAREEGFSFKRKASDSTADEYELISGLINDARQNDRVEHSPADELTEPLTEVAKNFGFEDGVIRAFGSRRLHFIMAGEDENGDRITSRELRLGIETASGVKLGVPEYFRHGKMALMECEARRAFAVECASGRLAGHEREVSGDSVSVFESGDDRFYAVISDGMGSGEVARKTSEFVVAFLERALEMGTPGERVMHLLNHAMRGRVEECSATVDIFELDLIRGDGVFIKSGSAPSFVKRGNSIFRIKSQTAPIGLMRSIDSERIRVEVGGEDYVIMVSDGVIQSAEESPWLLELLSRPAPMNLKEYVDLILSEAEKNSRSRDDMSVIVAKIIRI